MAESSTRSGSGPSAIIIIPARFASFRFPGKPLQQLRGAGGVSRPLIEWSWRAACAVPRIDRVLVATDDLRIAERVEGFGGQAVMTPAECRNGTERCAAAVREARLDSDIVINFQGDAPLTEPAMVQALVDRLGKDGAVQMTTPAVPCSTEVLAHLQADRAAGRVGGTTVVMDRHGRALYFSKEVLPFGAGKETPVHLHLGVYAYRPEALAAYVSEQPSPAELSEGLEQLRFLDLGLPVGVVVCPPPRGVIAELNNPSDLAIIERELQRRGEEVLPS